MKLIVAVDKNWAIGNKGQLLISIPADHKRFRQLTTGGVVILGRKTMDTFPGRQPLKDRTNIILSRDPSYTVNGATVLNSIEELSKELEKYDTEKVYVIGGQSIYEQLLPLCDSALVTRIDHAYQADAYFPDLDADPAWQRISESEEQTYFDLEYTFVDYKRVS